MVDYLDENTKTALIRMNANVEIFIAEVPDYDNDTVTVGVSIIDTHISNTGSVTLTLSTNDSGDFDDPGF